LFLYWFYTFLLFKNQKSKLSAFYSLLFENFSIQKQKIKLSPFHWVFVQGIHIILVANSFFLVQNRKTILSI